MQGLSTYQIAERLQITPNSVRTSLRNHGLIRESLGKSIEKAVATMLTDMGHNVVHHRGDHYFDLTVDGEKIDVKSGHLTKEKYPRYLFQLKDKKRPDDKGFNKDSIDWLYLVFLSDDQRPVFKLKAQEVKSHFNLSIYPKTAKYSLIHVGNLES